MTFLAATSDRDDLVDEPINPAWIMEGDPLARSVSLASPAGDGLWASVWDCTAGRFRWEYEIHEVIRIIEGHAQLTDVNGRVVDLREGDVASFAPGDVAFWEVPEYVRKLAVGTVAVSLPGRLLAKVRGRAARRRIAAAVPPPSVTAARTTR